MKFEYVVFSSSKSRVLLNLPNNPNTSIENKKITYYVAHGSIIKTKLILGKYKHMQYLLFYCLKQHAS